MKAASDFHIGEQVRTIESLISPFSRAGVFADTEGKVTNVRGLWVEVEFEIGRFEMLSHHVEPINES